MKVLPFKTRRLVFANTFSNQNQILSGAINTTENPNTVNGKIDLFRNAMVEWCENTTIHRLKNFSRSKNVIHKIIFISLLLISTGYCISSISETVISYLKYDFITRMQITNETPAYFPVISFCNLKMLNKLSAKSYLQTILNDANNNSLINKTDYGDNIYGYVNDIETIIQSSVASEDQTIEFQKSAGYNLSDMLISCSFNWKTCSEKDFKFFFNSIYGSCYSFNADVPPKSVSVQGPDYGLTIELFMGDPNVQTEYELDDGIVVVIHNQTNKPYFNSQRNLVSLGTETDLKITRNFIEKLGQPYSACINFDNNTDFHSEISDYIINKLKIAYTQQYCFLLCLQKDVMQICNCSSIWLPQYLNATYCKADKLNCSSSVTMDILDGIDNNICNHECPLECNFVDYKISTSRSTYPTPYYKSLLSTHSKINSSGIAYNDIEKAVLRVNIFYESMTYILYQETVTMTPDTLCSNIGGVLGLCTGASVLLIIEVIELIIVLFHINKSRNNSADQIP